MWRHTIWDKELNRPVLLHCCIALWWQDAEIFKIVTLGVSGTMWLNSLYIISVYEGFDKLAPINMTKSLDNHLWITQSSIQAASVADKNSSNWNTES